MTRTFDRLQYLERYDWKLGLWMVGLLIVSLMAGLCSGYSVITWLHAPYPKNKEVALYVTSQAAIMRGIEYRPGLPQMRVTYDEFIARSKGRPYIISYTDDLANNRVSTNTKIVNRSVSYTMVTSEAGIEMYIYAIEDPPNFDTDTAYDQVTRFDPTRHVYFSVVTGTDYGLVEFALILALICIVCAGACLGIGAGLWYDLPNRRYR